MVTALARRACSWVIAGAMLAGLVMPHAVADASEPSKPSDRKTVLLLYGEARLAPAIAQMDLAIRAHLAKSTVPLDVFAEYLDLSWVDTPRYEEKLTRFLRQKYERRRIDVLVPVLANALRFSLARRAEVFPAVPIVFSAVEPAGAVGLRLGPDVTGIWMMIDAAATLEAARRLQPDVRRAIVVGGTSALDRAFLEDVRQDLVRHPVPLEVSYLPDLPLHEARKALTDLPRHTIVLFVSMVRDGEGRPLVSRAVLEDLAATVRAPFYGLTETFVGHGIVGGRVISFETQGVRAAELVSRVLAGEPMRAIQQIDRELNVDIFDWRQLKRWGIDERRVPPGSVIRFREPTPWELWKWYIVGGVALIAVQGFLIAGLLARRAERRREQRALGERLRFEALLSELSATFVALPGPRIDDEIEKCLERIVEELSLDAAGLAEWDWRSDVAQITHSWTRGAMAPAPPTVQVNTFPWITAQLLEGHVVALRTPQDLPDEAIADRRRLIEVGTRSMAAVPLTVGGAIVAALWFSTQRAERDWPAEIVQRLRLLGEVFANTLARRDAENAVRESEARFRSMADTAPVLIWMSSPDMRCTFFNKGWLDFTGRSMEQEVDNGWLAGIHPDDRDECREKYVDAFEARREFSMEYRLRRYDDEYRWVLDQGVPRFAADGEFLGYIGCANDITRRKQAEERPRQVLEAAPNAMIMVTQEGTITLVNAAVEAVFGYARDELIGSSIEVLMPERFRAPHLAYRKNYFADPRVRAIAGRELFGRRKDGREVPVEIGLTPIKTSEGLFVLASIVDISARKQAELEVQRLRRDLAHVGRVATMGELTASLAHELNQPLTAILTNAQAALILLSSGRASAQELSEILSDIVSDDKRAGEVIRRLRSLLTKGESERTLLDLSEVTREVVRLVQTDAIIRNVSLEMELAAGLPLVAGDRVQLQQVILNLILNGLEAMRDSTIGGRRLLIATQQTETAVRVSIHDRGAGIHETDLSRIFEPFFTTKSSGMGMGLSIARSIVEGHGGSLWAENNAAGGATFSFAIPVG